MIALLLALQLVTDPCLQGAGGDPPANTITNPSINFCWSGDPQGAVFTILLDNTAIWTGPLVPKLRSPSGAWYFEWIPAPITVIADGLHEGVVVKIVSHGSTSFSLARPFLKKTITPAAFNVTVTDAP